MTTKTVPTRWELHRGHSPTEGAALARALGAPDVIGQVLWNRGLLDVDAARRFVEPRLEDLHDPWVLLGMRDAVARIERALERRERILIHGDYDVDGLTATYLLVAALRTWGGDVHHHIPHRTKDGYGLSTLAVEA